MAVRVIEQAKGYADTAAEVVSSAARKDPFFAISMLAVVSLLAWYVYQDHRLKEELLRLKLTDQQQTADRSIQITQFSDLLVSLQEENKEDRKIFVTMLESLERRDDDQFTRGEEWVKRLSAQMDEGFHLVSEKLDLVIQNQQIRTATQRKEVP